MKNNIIKHRISLKKRKRKRERKRDKNYENIYLYYGEIHY